VAWIVVGETTVKDAAMLRSVVEVAPVKLVPVNVTTVPIGPEAGVKLVIVGAAGTVEPQLGNLNDPMRVFQARLLVVEKYSFTYQKVQSSTGSTVSAL
jgi:hypothetical protein